MGERQQRKMYPTALFSFFCVGAITGSAAPRTQSHNAVDNATIQIEQRARVHTEEREKETTIKMGLFFSWVEEGALSHSQPRKDDGAQHCGKGARATLWPITNSNNELEDMVGNGEGGYFLEEFERAKRQKTKDAFAQSDYINCKLVTGSEL